MIQIRTNDYSYSHTRPEEGRWEMRKEGRIGEGKVGQEEESSAIYFSVLAVTWKQQISVNGTQTCKRLTCACVVVIPVDAVSMETVVVGVFWEQLNQRVMVWYHEDVFLLLHLSFPTRYTNGTMIKRTTATANTIPRMAPVLSPPVLRPPWSWGKRKFSYRTLVKLTTLFRSVLVKLDAQMTNDHAANHCILIPRLSPLSSLGESGNEAILGTCIMVYCMRTPIIVTAQVSHITCTHTHTHTHTRNIVWKWDTKLWYGSGTLNCGMGVGR